tara:strand:+ start:495 stop:1088 length:594 start_codon:yes stop_codon:yes gene_type:complete
VYPPVSILYGAYQSRALIRPSQVLISGEYFIGGDDVNDLGNSNNLNGLMKRPSDLPGQVIHELAHIQQARRNPLAVVSTKSLLNWAIYEGSADFIAFTINGTSSNQAAHDYLARNESALWCEFSSSTELNSNSNWISQDLYGEPPRGLAGIFGFQIAKAFYNQSQNKDEAFSDLIELDYEQIYLESGIKTDLLNTCL